MVLLDPLRSADPPINSGSNFDTVSIAKDEHSLVALFGFSLKYFFFSLLTRLSSLSKLLLFKILSKSFLVLDLFLFKLEFHFFSNSIPLFPISLQASKIFFGISKGLCFHFSFFLTRSISSSPSGEP